MSVRDARPHCVDQAWFRQARRLTMRSIEALTRSIPGPERVFKGI